MPAVTAADGTRIDYDRTGTGPAVILITGALGTKVGSGPGELAGLLAPDLTVLSYDRRGRGKSTDTPPYAVAREIEDLAALIDAAGGRAGLYGTSSGAALALEAGAALPGQVTGLALHEPPFIVDPVFPTLPADYVARLETALAAGDRGLAVELFLTQAIQLPAEYLPQMRASPMWPTWESVAHTLPYDGRIMGDRMSGKPFAAGDWAAATMPTLVLFGEESEPMFGAGARELVAHLAHATLQSLPGQGHDVADAVLAPILRDFFLAPV